MNESVQQLQVLADLVDRVDAETLNTFGPGLETWLRGEYLSTAYESWKLISRREQAEQYIILLRERVELLTRNFSLRDVMSCSICISSPRTVKSPERIWTTSKNGWTQKNGTLILSRLSTGLVICHREMMCLGGKSWKWRRLMSTFTDRENALRKNKQLPPTPRQLQRIQEYIDHPAIQPHLDKLMGDMDRNLKTRGGTGVLLGWMKEKITEYDKRHP